MNHLNRAAFAAFAPKAVPNTYEALEAAIDAYPVLAEAAVLDDWLGQMHHESQGFSVLTENLNYTVDALIAGFGRHRISVADAQTFGRIDKVVGGRKTVVRKANQSAIANLLYGGEWGRVNLGNTKPGDGWKNRGSGIKQITGAANIAESGFTAEELRTDIFKSALAAAKFFINPGCVELARKGDVAGVTRKINGGSKGLLERAKLTAAARAVIA